MVANNEQLPTTKYDELDLNFMGLILPRVGILVIRDPNQLQDPKHQTRLPGVVGMESGTSGLQGVHKIIWNCSF